MTSARGVACADRRVNAQPQSCGPESQEQAAAAYPDQKDVAAVAAKKVRDQEGHGGHAAKDEGGKEQEEHDEPAEQEAPLLLRGGTMGAPGRRCVAMPVGLARARAAAAVDADGRASGLLADKLVAHAIDRQDIAGIGRIGFQLAAQVLDMGINAAIVAVVGDAVQPVQQLARG